jgi:hypothetical protein
MPHQQRSHRTRLNEPDELNIHLPYHDFAVRVAAINRPTMRAYALAFGQAFQMGHATADKKAADLGNG